MDSKQSSEKRFALLIDADNVSAKYIKPIMDELSKYGTVTYKRIYGDWTLTMHAKWKDALLENSITPIQQFGYTQGKNATDSAMIIDAMDILYTHSVDGFCIVSSDSDFTRLAARIRESGLTVIGMGEKKTPTPFRKACDIFTTLELLVGEHGGKGNRAKTDANGGQSGHTLGKDEVEQAVVDIITDNQNNGKATGLGEVGSRLLKRYPDFDVRSYGTNLLSKLLGEFSRVKITKDGSSVAVELVDDKAHERPASSGEDSAVSADPKPVEGKPALSKPAEKKPALPKPAEKEPEDAALRPAEKKPEDAALRPADDTGEKKERRTRRPRKVVPVSEEARATRDSGEEKQEKQEKPLRDAASKTEKRDPRRSRRMSAKPERKLAVKAKSEKPAVESMAAGDPASYIRQLIGEAGPDGIALSVLGKRVRAKFHGFKVRDLGYTQLKGYVLHLGDVELERIGKETFVRLGE